MLMCTLQKHYAQHYTLCEMCLLFHAIRHQDSTDLEAAKSQSGHRTKKLIHMYIKQPQNFSEKHQFAIVIPQYKMKPREKRTNSQRMFLAGNHGEKRFEHRETV